MRKEKELVPKRRFERYRDNESWQEIKLGENAIIKGRLGWKSLKKEEYIDNGPSMIAGKHIKNGIINWSEVDHIPLWRYEESPEIMLKNGDVIFSKDGSLGNPALITGLKGKATINATMMLVRANSKSLAANFFYQILNSKQFFDLVYLKVSGSSIPHLFQEDMKSFKFYAPTVNEQQKIGEFFKVLDERIANQEQKIAKVKALKSAYLTEMFPQEGETVPKRRFKGFEGDWETIELGKIGKSFAGLSGKTKKDFGQGTAEFVTYMNVFNNTISDIKVTEKVVRDDTQTQLKYGDILFTTSSETPDEVGMSSVWLDNRPNVYLNSFCFGLRPSIFLDYYFIGYLLRANLFRKQIEILAQGISRYNISKGRVMEIGIYLPSIEEQQKIGLFFNNLDDQIRTEEKKLEKLKKMKEAYLEEMFV